MSSSALVAAFGTADAALVLLVQHGALRGAIVSARRAIERMSANGPTDRLMGDDVRHIWAGGAHPNARAVIDAYTAGIIAERMGQLICTVRRAVHCVDVLPGKEFEVVVSRRAGYPEMSYLTTEPHLEDDALRAPMAVTGLQCIRTSERSQPRALAVLSLVSTDPRQPDVDLLRCLISRSTDVSAWADAAYRGTLALRGAVVGEVTVQQVKFSVEHDHTS
jgi:hypothetical protein